jgi:hypothetical protein
VTTGKDLLWFRSHWPLQQYSCFIESNNTARAATTPKVCQPSTNGHSEEVHQRIDYFHEIIASLIVRLSFNSDYK